MYLCKIKSNEFLKGLFKYEKIIITIPCGICIR